MDVSNPAAPRETGFYETGGRVEVVGDYAYLACGSLSGNGLRIINISNPTYPSEVGFYGTTSSASYVAVAGNYAYVSAQWLRIIDVSDPAHPFELSRYETPGDPENLTVAGNYAYVLDWGWPDGQYVGLGLRIINVADPANIYEAGFYETPGDARALAVAGNYAYITDRYEALHIVDVSNSATPSQVGLYETFWADRGVAVLGDYVYLTGGGRFSVLNTSDPGDPSQVGYFYTAGYPGDVDAVGNYAYIADGDGGLFILRFTGGPVPTATPTSTPTETPTPTPTATPTGLWFNWRDPGRPLLLPLRGTTVDVDYGNIPVPATLTATLTGPALFSDGSQTLTAEITAANGSYTLHLRPAAGATLGDTFTLEVTLADLRLERVGTIAGELYLPLIRKEAP